MLLLLLAGASCAHAPPPLPADLPSSTAWHTMRAEHRVTVEAGGQKRTLRGLIAVERPDRFRLRALGPAGITLFDIVSVGGQVRVNEAIKDPKASALGKILPSMAGDLQAAYDLTPRPPERMVTREGAATVIRENGRVVRETPASIDIDNTAGGYKVHVDVVSVERDVALDPALWAQ